MKKVPRATRAVYNLYDAKSALSELIERASNGEEIIIAKNGAPRAKLVPIGVAKRRPGVWKGRGKVSADFDDPLPPEILAAFGGDGL